MTAAQFRLAPIAQAISMAMSEFRRSEPPVGSPASRRAAQAIHLVSSDKGRPTTPDTFQFSYGRNVNDNHPKQVKVADFDGFIAWLDQNRAELKDGAPYLCGSVNDDGRRCADGALPRRWLPVDLDRIAPETLVAVRGWFGRFSACRWPTHSSKPDAPRERVILELDRDASRNECIQIGRALLHDLTEKYGSAVWGDESTFRNEQPIFLPPTGATLARFNGDPLNVDRYLEAARQLPADAPERPTGAERGAGKATQGRRNETLSGEAYRLRKKGYAVEQITAVLIAMNRTVCDPPLDEAEVRAIAQGKARVEPDTEGAKLTDFHAYMPSHQYMFVPTRELWPASSVNGRVRWPEIDGKPVAPASWLDKHRPVEQMVWHPDEPQIIEDRVMQVSGWVNHAGAAVFNLYRPPTRPTGDPAKAGPWVEHVKRIYPEDSMHITRWLAHRVQRPGDKVNHALVLGGAQGIGKDTLLEPLKAAVGPWNWSDINPGQMLGRFNGWLKAVVIRCSEARDLGDVDRFAFYDHSKAILAAPPDVLLVDEKHLRETYVANVCGVIVTTNHLSDGLYLPADDRRHYVAWSQLTRTDFDAGYWQKLYRWFESGGLGHVGAYLAGFDLTGFDAKAPPPQTAAFWAIVAAGDAPESGELRDVIDAMSKPAALSLQLLVNAATTERLFDLADELKERKTRRALPHRLERVGYVPVRNPDAEDGLFKLSGKRQAVYAKRSLNLAEQVREARKLT